MPNFADESEQTDEETTFDEKEKERLFDMLKAEGEPKSGSWLYSALTHPSKKYVLSPESTTRESLLKGAVVSSALPPFAQVFRYPGLSL